MRLKSGLLIEIKLKNIVVGEERNGKRESEVRGEGEGARAKFLQDRL